MSVQSQNNVINVAVGLNVSGIAIASVQITDPSTTATYISDGQTIALGLNAGTGKEEVIPTSLSTTTGAALYPSIRLVTNNAGLLNFTSRIFARDVIKANGIDGTASAEQVSIVGYNGTTGSIDANATNMIFTFVGDWDYELWEQQKYQKAFNYFSLTPTQQSVAVSFVSQFNFDGSRATLNGTGPMASAVTLNDGTAASPATAATAIVVNGSDIVTLNAADAGIQVVGTILRLGNTSTSATGRGVTVPVYVVIATPTTDSTLSAAQVRLNTFFQGTTDAALDLTTDAGVVATATNWGMKFTGLPLTWGIPPYSDFKYNKVSFHFSMVGFGATTVSNPTVASRGQGTYQEVAEFEYFAQGNEGALNRTVIPLPIGRHATIVDGSIVDYDTVIILDNNRSGSPSPISGKAPMAKQTYVFAPDGAANMTKLLTQLNPWLTAAGVISSNISV